MQRQSADVAAADTRGFAPQTMRYNRGMSYRKLRIAWSIFWGVTTLPLIALWIRGNYWLDDIYVPIGSSSYFHAGSVSNHVGVAFDDTSPSDTWFWAAA